MSPSASGGEGLQEKSLGSSKWLVVSTLTIKHHIQGILAPKCVMKLLALCLCFPFVQHKRFKKYSNNKSENYINPSHVFPGTDMFFKEVFVDK